MGLVSVRAMHCGLTDELALVKPVTIVCLQPVLLLFWFLINYTGGMRISNN